jgi:hypothetical protein
MLKLHSVEMPGGGFRDSKSPHGASWQTFPLFVSVQPKSIKAPIERLYCTAVYVHVLFRSNMLPVWHAALATRVSLTHMFRRFADKA